MIHPDEYGSKESSTQNERTNQNARTPCIVAIKVKGQRTRCLIDHVEQQFHRLGSPLLNVMDGQKSYWAFQIASKWISHRSRQVQVTPT
ncbi:hypothetical protein M8J77_006954 [Diaphorina citri]|nr:hypothetical protein M8J77_006954 [Diaphorina citri]